VRQPLKASDLRAIGVLVVVLSVSVLARAGRSEWRARGAAVAVAHEAGARSGGVPRRSASRRDGTAFRRDGKLDLNRATEAELGLLPRVGPKLAARIAAERASRGGFSDPSELLVVSGIGPRVLEAIQAAAYVGQTKGPRDSGIGLARDSEVKDPLGADRGGDVDGVHGKAGAVLEEGEHDAAEVEADEPRSREPAVDAHRSVEPRLRDR
jgi:hypothetical protein